MKNEDRNIYKRLKYKYPDLAPIIKDLIMYSTMIGQCESSIIAIKKIINMKIKKELAWNNIKWLAVSSGLVCIVSAFWMIILYNK